MAIQGLRTSANFLANARPENFRETILFLYPNSAEMAKAPLTALTSLMKTRTTDDPVFHWFEKSMQTRRVALGQNLTAPAAGTTQSVVVTGGALGFKRNDVFLIEQTKEIVEVAADPESDLALVLKRGVAGSTVTAVTYAGAGVNPNLFCIGSAFEEGSLAPTGVQFDPQEVSNYTQIFRSAIEFTRTAANTRLRTPDQVKEAKREGLEILSVDIERGLWWGKKLLTSRNGKPLRYMNGVYHSLPADNKITHASGNVSLDDLDGYMLRIFKEGSSEKIAFGGNTALAAINAAVRKNSTYNIEKGVSEYGMSVTRITSPFGELVFKSHPLFTQTAGGVTGGTAYAGLDSSMFVLDAAQLKYVYFNGCDIHFEDKLEVPGYDGMKKGWIGELSLELGHASTHFYFANLKAGVADA